jgi:hypothetical protein
VGSGNWVNSSQGLPQCATDGTMGTYSTSCVGTLHLNQGTLWRLNCHGKEMCFNVTNAVLVDIYFISDGNNSGPMTLIPYNWCW